MTDDKATGRLIEALSKLGELAGRATRRAVRASATRIPLHRVFAHFPEPVRALGRRFLVEREPGATDHQDLDVYWDAKMAATLETWGADHVWKEIQLLLAPVRGSVVDIACGTGIVMDILRANPNIELWGFDISDFLIGKASARGIPRERLAVCDATKTGYSNNQFNYGYSIGSLEHFTENGIADFLAETNRITRYASFHQIPTSRSGKNEGWKTLSQSYFNNSVEWWLEGYHSAYRDVLVLDSGWNDRISVGKWFVCLEDFPDSPVSL